MVVDTSTKRVTKKIFANLSTGGKTVVNYYHTGMADKKNFTKHKGLWCQTYSMVADNVIKMVADHKSFPFSNLWWLRIYICYSSPSDVVYGKNVKWVAKIVDTAISLSKFQTVQVPSQVLCWQ